MPVYVVGCDCGHREDIFRKIDDRDLALPEHCGKAMVRKLTPPMVRCDEQVIRSQVDGKIYTSRGKYRQHLKDQGMIEVGNDSAITNPKPRAPLKAPPGLKETLIRAYDQHSTT